MTVETKRKNAAENDATDLRGKTILVTGGGGMLGSAVVRTLLGRGVKVRVLDDWSTGREASLPAQEGLDKATGSVLDPAAVQGAVAGCDAVVHLAATPITVSLRDPDRDCDVNVRGTVNVLMAARGSATVRRVVYGSSDSVYGNPRYLPINEDDAVSPLSPFAVSKLAGEQYCRAFYETFGLSTTVLRFANVYGPAAAAGVAGHFFAKALAGAPLQVHGDGEQTRDFVFLDDAVDATLRACAASKAEGQVYNVGTGIETTVNALADLVRAATRSRSPLETVDRQDVDNIRRRVLNIERIRRELRWTPQFTLDRGLRRMMEAAAP
jgi:UDP-glucose 4-epimerase